MFERYTDRARRVVVLAQEAARQSQSRAITSEHILMGMAWEGESNAAQFLLQNNLTPERIEAALEPDPEPKVMVSHIPFLRQAKTALELGLREALKLGHNYIGCEHILLALLGYPQQTGTTGLFERLGLDVRATHRQFVAYYAQVVAETPPPVELQILPGTQLQYVDVLRALGRVLQANRRLLVPELIKVQPDTAPVAEAIIDSHCRAIGFPNPSLPQCIHNVGDLNKLVKLLNRINAFQQVDPTLPKTMHLFVQDCARQYRQWVLGQD